MIQNALFNIKPKKKLNGMYYDPARELYVSYVNGKLFGEWNEDHFKDEGFNKESMMKVRERTI